MTKTEILKLARAVYGSQVSFSEDRKAPTANERQVATARAKDITDLLSEIDEALEAEDSWEAPLLKAARFVVDVDGGEPSLSQLSVALQRAERHAYLNEERRDLKTERDALPRYGYRFIVGVTPTDDPPRMNLVKLQADTLDELADELKKIKEGRSR
jgi:hypothetical protein